MASIFNSVARIHPSFLEPELIITQSQASGFRFVLAGSALRVKIGPVDKAIYMNAIDVRTQTATNQATHNMLPGATILGKFIQTATYNWRTRNEYSEFDVAEAGEWNVSLPEAYRLAARQATFQGLRNAALYGVNAANYEGLLNTPGATTVNLPPDSWGHTTLQTYDNGELAVWVLGLIVSLLTRMYNLGTPQRIVILAPQRVIGQMEFQNIIQLTSYQRPGAGTGTTAQTITKIAEEFDVEVEWAFDDTLIDQGATISGAPSDAVLVVCPELNVNKQPGINTNEFARLAPNQVANTLQYADVVAPVEVTTPIPEGVDVTSTMRASSGWCIRPQAITIASLPY